MWVMKVKREPSFPALSVGVRPKHDSDNSPAICQADCDHATRNVTDGKRCWVEIYDNQRSVLDPVDACWSDDALF